LIIKHLQKQIIIVTLNNMKEITLIHYQNPDKQSIYTKSKLYRLSLGNNVTIALKSKREFDAQMVAVNKTLNNCLYAIVSMHTEIIKLYFDAWFYMDDKTLMCEHYINRIPELLNLIIDRSSHSNGNFFVFNHMYHIIVNINSTLDNIIRIRKKKNHQSEIKKAQSFKLQLENIKYTLDNIGKSTYYYQSVKQ
jgi:small nuclear ribonucleoprotein (snRNP)-like protein